MASCYKSKHFTLQPLWNLFFVVPCQWLISLHVYTARAPHEPPFPRGYWLMTIDHLAGRHRLKERQSQSFSHPFFISTKHDSCHNIESNCKCLIRWQNCFNGYWQQRPSLLCVFNLLTTEEVQHLILLQSPVYLDIFSTFFKKSTFDA